MTHFISFGGPSPFYYRAVNRICGEAKETKLFDSVIGYTDEHLKSDKEFWKKHGKFITENRKGYGYWLWKPYLIKKRLNEIKEGELLFYSDAGSGFNLKYSSDFIKIRIEEVKKTKKMMGITTCLERNYNKIDLVKYFGYENSPFYLRQKQKGGGAILMMKTPEVVNLINEWYEIGYKDNYHFIDDSPSKAEEPKGFKVHRHDQSIYSLLTKKYNILLNTSLRGHRETFFHTYRRRNGPFLTEKTNHIGINLKKANAGGIPPNRSKRKPKNVKKEAIEKDVLEILLKYVKNNKLTINNNYNKLFTDIAFKREKYLHIKYKNSNNTIYTQTFFENKPFKIDDIKHLECAIYSTNPCQDFAKTNKVSQCVIKKPVSKDVSEIVKTYLKNYTLSFNEKYNSKFTDIYYGKPKKLEIKYKNIGLQEKKVVFNEDEPIHIEDVDEILESIYMV